MRTYNGWTNYETWNLKLWMDNEAGTYSYHAELAEELLENAEPDFDFETKMDKATRDFASYLKDEIMENIPEEAVTGFYADMLGASISQINWQEIAESVMEETSEEVS